MHKVGNHTGTLLVIEQIIKSSPDRRVIDPGSKDGAESVLVRSAEGGTKASLSKSVNDTPDWQIHKQHQEHTVQSERDI